MEKKRTTLRSQTVQCPHCGEYYSVTYSHCPFCSEGRREAEEEKNASFFGSLFGGKKADKNREKQQGEHTGRSHHEEPEAQKATRKSASSKDGHRSGTRKKISEMTPEERAAFDEDRRIRAEQRKRERDRKAREEARLTSGGMIDIEGPTESGADPAAAQGAVQISGGGMEQEFILIQPKKESVPAPESVSVEVPPEVSAEIPVEAPVAESVEIPVEDPKAEPVEIPVEAPVAESEEVPVSESPVAETAPETSPAEAVSVSESAAPPSVDKIESDEDLDALLNEIRHMISRSPVPTLSKEQIAAKVVAPPVEELVDALIPQTQTEAEPVVSETETAAPGEVQKSEAAVAEKAQEPESAVAEKSAEEEPPAQAETAPSTSQEPESPAEAEKPETAEEPPVEPKETQAVSEAAEQKQDGQLEIEDGDVMPGGPLPFGEVEERETPIPVAPGENQTTPTRDSRDKRRKKESKKAGKPPILLLLSIVIVVIAAIILVKCIVPAFQTGILSGGETAATEIQAVEGGAQTFTLDRTEAAMAEKGASITLIPTFAPEGTTGILTWASSDPAIATVDAAGLVTSVTPGVVTITAALPNGQTATCTVTCDWQVEQGPTLSAGAVTLDGQGKTVKLEVNGAAGTPTWTSDKPEVAAVASDGTISAVAKGTATITAKVDGKDLTCKVDCIW